VTSHGVPAGEHYRELIGLPLVPLAHGGVGCFDASGGPASAVHFVVGDAERQLWVRRLDRVVASAADLMPHSTDAVDADHRPVIDGDGKMDGDGKGGAGVAASSPTGAAVGVVGGGGAAGDGVGAGVGAGAASSASAGRASTLAPLVHVVEDVLAALKSSALQAHLNVRMFRHADTSELLRSVLPPEWSTASCVQWEGDAADIVCPRSWLHTLWVFLRPAAQLSDAVGSWCVVPCVAATEAGGSGSAQMLLALAASCTMVMGPVQEHIDEFLLVVR
jgi:hypothetical protein